MKLVYVCALDIAAKSGALDHVLGVVNGLSSLGVDITLVARSSLEDRQIETPANTRIANTAGMSMPRSLAAVSKLARRVIGEIRPDCVYLRNYALDYPLLVRHLVDVPIYLELNAILESEYRARRQFLRGKIYAHLQRKTIASAAAWLPTTSQVLAFCRDASPVMKPNLLARNGVWVEDWKPTVPRTETRRNLGTPPNARVLVMAGFEKEWHGWDRAVETLQFLGRDYELWLIGSTDEVLRQRVQELATANGVGDQVKILGWLDKAGLADMIFAADVGLGALALDRKNMVEIQALKIGTYLALGTPAVINCPDPRISSSDATVALVETTDPKSLATGIRGFFEVAERDRESIQDYARKHMDWLAVAREVHRFILSNN